MEFKKCVRCGAFFVTEGDVCQNCMPKDRLDMVKFRDYIENNQDVDISADNISVNTGISIRNVNRYLNQNGSQNIQL